MDAPLGNILVVDDTPDNLRLLSAMLTERGYKVRQALNGQMALTTVRRIPPDLILLDINMPQINGYDVCSQLKADEQTREIPVIFISALDDVLDKVKAFKVGGGDYITKPFQTEEVLARIENQLNLRRLQKQLTEQNAQLRQMAVREKLLSQIAQRIRQSLNLQEILTTTVTEVRQFLQTDRVVICQLKADGSVAIAQESVAREELSILNANLYDPCFSETYIQEYREGRIYAIEDIYTAELRQCHIDSLAQLKVRSNLVVPILQRSVDLGALNEELNEDFSSSSTPDSQLYGLLIAHHCSGTRRWQESEVELLKQLSTQIGIALQQGELYHQLRRQQEQSEKLLLNILPNSVAQRLKQEQGIIADNFEEVSVLFADIVGFTPLSARICPIELVKLLNQIFSTFDNLAERHGLEKIKTIGDAYMVVGGLPLPLDDPARAIAEMALDMQQAIANFQADSGEQFQIRIGINTGPVVAGVIGTRKFIYDLWGDTVNVASRMESTGVPGCIQVTATTYERLKDRYEFEERGTIEIKGKGEMMTYWLKDRKALKGEQGTGNS